VLILVGVPVRARAPHVGFRLRLGGVARLVAGARLVAAIAVAFAVPFVVTSAPRAFAAPEPECSDRALADRLLTLFTSADAPARRAAATELGLCHAPGSGAALARAARIDEDGEVRVSATRALAAIDVPEARGTLSELARMSADPSVRHEAVRALGDLNDRPGLWAVVGDTRLPPAERALAFDRLGAPVSPEESARIEALIPTAPPALAKVAEAMLQRARPQGPPPPAVVEGPPAPSPAAVEGPLAPARMPSLEEPTREEPTRVEPLRAEPRDGLPLAVAASGAAGGALFPLLALMSGLDSPGALVLTGSAGAVIGAGTTWGLSRFGYRPTLAQAAWYATATTWGTLAGATISSSAGFSGTRLRYGSIMLGEVVGLGAGIATAKAVTWTGGQVVVANSLVLGAGLVGLGVDRLRASSGPPSPIAAVAIVPWMIGSAFAAHALDPTPNDLHLMFVSATAGAWTGGLLTSGLQGQSMWHSRVGHGGLALGAGGGYLLAAGAAAFTDVPAARTWESALMMPLGNVVGLGVEKLARPGAPERWNFGTSVGGAAFALGTFVYQPYARFGDSAPSMGVTGFLLAPTVAAGAFAARDGVSPHGDARTQRDGAVQAAAVVGTVTGALASRHFHPDARDELTTSAFTGLGMSGGLGVAKLAVGTRGNADAIGVTAGAGVGFVGGAIFSHLAELRAPEVGAGFVGAATGAFGGALALTLREPTWQGSRRDGAGLALGVPVGALAGGALARALDADVGNVREAMWAGVLGLGTGAGVGFLLPGDARDTRALREATLAGTAAFIAGSILLEPKLHLGEEGAGPGGASLFFEGALVGGAWGLMAGRVLDADAHSRHLTGGLLAGASLGATSGLVLSKVVEPRAQGYWLTLSAGTAGALGGWGVADLAYATGGRHDTSLALAGSVAGFVGAAAASRALTLDAVDAHAGLLGAPAGALLGGLALSLAAPAGPARTRELAGGVLLGTSLGGLGGVALRQVTQASDRAVGLTALGGLDGLMGGLGVGLMLDEPGSRAERTGALVGGVAGLGVGAALWPRLHFDEGDGDLVQGAGVAAAWTGLWLPALGAARWEDVSRVRMAGGVLAGLGVGTIASSALTPVLAIDGDLVENALWMDAVFSGAGVSAGVVASARADRQAAALLVGGTTGLVLGAALHDRIDLNGDDVPWVTFGILEGGWLGAWAPHALYPRADVTSAREFAGLAAGALGLGGVAALSSGSVHLDGGETALALTGSAIGGALAGGVALLSTQVHDQSSAGVVMGGTVVGAVAGAALAPHLDFEGRALPYALLGATLGSSEASLFAWASRGATNDDYGGAALIGAGAGATLGLAAAAHPFLTAPSALASSGFAAWGAWMGAFAGAAYDPRAPRISGFGMAGADVGFLAGYGLLKLDILEPRDFGWISLGGALGTVGGGIAGAVFTKSTDRAPLWVGLSVGPIVGMIASGIALPTLRKLHTVPVASNGPGRRARADANPLVVATGAEDGDEDDGGPITRPARFSQVLAVEQCAPFFGALPTTPDNPAPPPVLLGVTGLWR
jgi:HEAT repeats